MPRARRHGPRPPSGLVPLPGSSPAPPRPVRHRRNRLLKLPTTHTVGPAAVDDVTRPCSNSISTPAARAGSTSFVAEADRRGAVGVAVELAVQLLRLAV